MKSTYGWISVHLNTAKYSTLGLVGRLPGFSSTPGFRLHQCSPTGYLFCTASASNWYRSAHVFLLLLKLRDQDGLISRGLKQNPKSDQTDSPSSHEYYMSYVSCILKHLIIQYHHLSLNNRDTPAMLSRSIMQYETNPTFAYLCHRLSGQRPTLNQPSISRTLVNQILWRP